MKPSYLSELLLLQSLNGGKMSEVGRVMVYDHEDEYGGVSSIKITINGRGMIADWLSACCASDRKGVDLCTV